MKIKLETLNLIRIRLVMVTSFKVKTVWCFSISNWAVFGMRCLTQWTREKVLLIVEIGSSSETSLAVERQWFNPKRSIRHSQHSVPAETPICCRCREGRSNNSPSPWKKPLSYPPSPLIDCRHSSENTKNPLYQAFPLYCTTSIVAVGFW